MSVLSWYLPSVLLIESFSWNPESTARAWSWAESKHNKPAEPRGRSRGLFQSPISRWAWLRAVSWWDKVFFCPSPDYGFQSYFTSWVVSQILCGFLRVDDEQLSYQGSTVFISKGTLSLKVAVESMCPHWCVGGFVVFSPLPNLTQFADSKIITEKA